MAEQQSPMILALVRDLMFSGRIAAEARAAGVDCKIIREPAKIPSEGRLLIVDLNMPGAVEAAQGWGKAAGQPVVGFVAHTDAQTSAQAKQAGNIRIIVRSQFVRELPDLLKSSLSA
jgi:hypothetical protein